MEVKIIRRQKPSQHKTGCYARFTKKEKDVLYSLFRQHEKIIDIKYRKSCMDKKNMNMTVRECWQRIVNLYNAHSNITTQRNIKQIQKFWLNSRLRKQFPPRQKFENSTIKCEPDMIMPVNSIKTIEQHVFENNVYEEQQQITSNENDVMQNITNCIEQISPEKLSLNDLLHFKNTPSTTAKTIHETSINSELRNEQHTQTSPTIATITTTTTGQLYDNQTIQGEQTSSMEYQSLLHLPSQSDCDVHHRTYVTETLEDKLNYFKMKEAELKYEEEQIRVEKLKIDLEKSKEELKHMKEVNQLQIEEMRIKLRILNEQTIKTNNGIVNKCSNS